MKKHLVLIYLLVFYNGYSQTTTNNFTFDGINREYLSYVPSSYDPLNPAPLVICLHGLGDNMNNFSGIGMNYVADTANFIVVTPEAIVDGLLGSTAWNSGASYLGFTLNSNVDDLGFINALIDTISTNYSIDQSRVYACGFSMGGFMAQRLACELNNRIAAIASVAGTIGDALTCTPNKAVSVCHFHGTSDATINYTGNQYGTDAEETVNFWVSNNNCNPSNVVTTSLPNTNPNDGYTVDHSIYSGCDDNTEVEFYKVNGAGHVWLGPTNDIFYTTEIWDFFRKHQNSGSAHLSAINPISKATIYPNPSKEFATLEINSNVKENVQIHLFDVKGKILKSYKKELHFGINNIEFNLQGFNSGSYLISIQTNKIKHHIRLQIK